MPKTYYDSELTGEQIESALEAIDGVVTPSNNGKILRVKDGNIEAVSASEYTSGIDVESLSATANGTYTAPAGKAYSPVTVNVSGGGGGGNLPSGGADGDLLVKNGATDYDATWKKTPPQMGSLATIETSPATQAHVVGEYIVYNGQLYKVTTAISQGQTLTPGSNIAEAKISDAIAESNATITYTETSGTSTLEIMDQTRFGPFYVVTYNIVNGSTAIARGINAADITVNNISIAAVYGGGGTGTTYLVPIRLSSTRYVLKNIGDTFAARDNARISLLFFSL